MKEDKKNIKKEEDTKYGEFICSYFSWITPSKQKEKAKELSKMTKDENKNKN